MIDRFKNTDKRLYARGYPNRKTRGTSFANVKS